jgi:hypothetical protein
MHRSALGKSVDMSSLVSKNEKTRAVGNMNVNARGDVIDSHGRIIQDNTQRVRRQYNNTVKRPSSITEDQQPEIVTPIPVVEAVAPDLNIEEQKMFEDFDDYEEVEEIKQAETDQSKAKK